MPKISVVMPAYNAEKYIGEAIESILNQTFTDFEFIIIDDCSTDATADIINSYNDKRIKFYKNEKNMGVAATLNRGLDFASGEYIARMDSDDISFPNRFERQVEFMDANLDIGICGSNIITFGEGFEEKERIFSQSDDEIRVDMIFSSAFVHPAVMLRKSVLKENNIKYDSEYEKAEDYNLWLTMLQFCKGHNLNEVLFKYRYHKSQVTKTHIDEANLALIKIRKKVYDTFEMDNDRYLNIFSRICSGERDFNSEEYLMFTDLVKESLSHNKRYNSKILKYNWSAVNCAIYNECKPSNFKIISFSDVVIIVKSYVYKLINRG